MTSTGYIKLGYIVLIGDELYLYSNKDSNGHHEMAILKGTSVLGSTKDEPYKILNNS